MSSILPLVVIAILVVPMLIIIRLMVLSGKVKEITSKLEFLRSRLAHVEQELSGLKEKIVESSPGPAPIETLMESEVDQSIVQEREVIMPPVGPEVSGLEPGAALLPPPIIPPWTTPIPTSPASIPERPLAAPWATASEPAAFSPSEAETS